MHKTSDYGWSQRPPRSASYLNTIVVELAKKTGATTVLDAGCGNGFLAGELHRAGFDVTGVDADENGLEIARQREPGPKFMTGNFEAAPPGVFDLVCSTEVVEHLYSPHDLARYCFDALRPAGTLIISTPYHGYIKNVAIAVTNKWDHHHMPNLHGGHIKFWSRAELSRLLEQAGFVMKGFTGAGRVPYLWKSMILIAQRP